MKKFLLLGAFIFLMLSEAFSSQHISYQYDSAGNRIKRKVIILSKAPENKSKLSNFEDVTNVLDGVKLSVYPNPVEDLLEIKIEGLQPSDITGKISIYSMSGKLIEMLPMVNNTLQCPMQQYSSGIYILRLELNGTKTEYKIIKK